MDDVSKAVTMDLKRAENTLYVIGETRNELGGSHYGLVTGGQGGQVPHVDRELAPQIFAAMHRAINEGLIQSCHDLSEGGLAVAAAEMGIEIDLPLMVDQTGIDDSAVLLFSESQTRFLVEVAPEDSEKFEACFVDLPCLPIGEVAAHDRVKFFTDIGEAIVDASLAELKSAWQRPLDWN